MIRIGPVKLLHTTRLSWGIANPREVVTDDPRCVWLLKSEVQIDKPEAERGDTVTLRVPREIAKREGLIDGR